MSHGSISNDEFLPLLKTLASALPKRLLVVGDPGRVDTVLSHLANVAEISQNREYRCAKGTFEGQEVGVVSHGIGSAGGGICFEELCRSGASRIIRVGSAGGMQDAVKSGDVVIATGAVREDGLSHKLVPATYPAIVSANVLTAMRAAAQSLGYSCHEGLVLTCDLFYPHDVLGSDLKLWRRAGIAAVEMECAALFVICSLCNVESGAVVAVDGNPLAQDDAAMNAYDPDKDSVRLAVDRSIRIALHAVISENSG